MRLITHLSLSLLIAVYLVGLAGCQDSGKTSVAKTDTSQHDDDHDHDHEEGDHDHDGEDHADHEHGDGEHEHPETYDEAVAHLVEMHEAIKAGFANDEIDDAHDPLHDVGHLLEDTEKLIDKSDMDDETKKSLHEAVENLFASFGAVDDKLHDAEEGKDYDEVAEQIETSIKTLQQHVSNKPEE